MKLIIGPAASGKTTRIFREIRQAMENAPREKVIYIVPEQVTMKVQKQLTAAVPGHSLMGVNVLSFKRLAYQVLSETAGALRTFLSDTGKCMVLVKIARDHQDELMYYGRNVTQRGFIGQMKLMVTEIIQYGLTEETLREMAGSAPEGSILRAKLSDIALLWHYFLEYTGEHVLASESLLDLLEMYVKDSRLIRSAVIYIDDFNGFTVQEYRLIRQFLKYSRGVCLSLSMTERAFDEAEQTVLSGRIYRDLAVQPFFTVQKTVCRLISLLREEGRTYEVIRMRQAYRSNELMHATNAICHLKTDPWKRPAKDVRGRILPDPQSEVKFVFRLILKMLRDEHMRLSDIAIMACDLENYDDLFAREASLYGFTVFIDRKIDAASNPYIQYLEALGELSVYGYSADSFLKLVKTGLFGLSQDKADQLENQLIARNTFGILRIRELLEESEDEELVTLSRELGAFERKTRGKKTVLELTQAYTELTESYHIRERLGEWADFLEEEGDLASAMRYRRIYEEAGKVQDQLVSVLSNLSVSMQEYTEILKIGLEQLKLGQVPPSMDELLIGDMKRTRLTGQKAVIFTGMNSGSFPWPASSAGLLTDTERQSLVDHYELAAGEKEKLAEQYYLLYTAMGKAGEKIILTGSSGDGEGGVRATSVAYRRLSAVLPDGFEMRQDEVEEDTLPLPMLYDPGEDLSPAMLAYLRSHGLEEAVSMIEKGKGYHPEAGVLSRRVALYLMDPTRKRLSVTQLEKYASCPFAYYLGRALHLKEREAPQVRALEDGNVIHDMLKEAGDYLKHALTEEEAAKLSRDLLEKRQGEFAVYQTNGRYRYYWQKLQKTAARAFRVLSEQAALTDFTESSYEWPFGGVKQDGTMDNDPVREVKIGNISLTGKIDRIDVMTDEGERFVRVIDYKTGRTGYEPGKIYEGLTLQLPVYLKVAADEFEAQPAGFFYFHVAQPIGKMKKFAEMKKAETIDGQMQPYRLDGVVLDDVEIASRMDHSIAEGSGKVLRTSVTKGGKLDARSHTASREQLQDLSRFVERKIGEIAGRMQEGDIRRSPADDTCKYCEFRRACPFDPKSQRGEIRKTVTMKDNEFFKAIRSEEE